MHLVCRLFALSFAITVSLVFEFLIWLDLTLVSSADVGAAESMYFIIRQSLTLRSVFY